jgi:hypothetical protein
VATLFEKFDTLAVLDSLQREENPLSNSGKWERSFLANNIGKATATGWVTTTSNTWAAASWIDLAYASPCACLSTLAVLPTTNEHNVGLSLFGSTNKAGTEHTAFGRLKLESGSKYFVYIGYYEGGVYHELAFKSGVTLAAGDRFALSYDPSEEKGFKLSRKPAAGAWETLVSATASEVPVAKLGSYAGIVGFGSTSTVYRLTNFAAGSLLIPRPGSLSLLGVGR